MSVKFYLVYPYLPPTCPLPPPQLLEIDFLIAFWYTWQEKNGNAIWITIIDFDQFHYARLTCTVHIYAFHASKFHVKNWYWTCCSAINEINVEFASEAIYFLYTINMHNFFLAGISQQSPAIIQQQQQFMPSSHTSNGRGNEQDEMLAQIRDQPHYDAHEQYSRGRTAPAAVPDNRSYRTQYDAPREIESPNVSVVLVAEVCLINWWQVFMICTPFNHGNEIIICSKLISGFNGKVWTLISIICVNICHYL